MLVGRVRADFCRSIVCSQDIISFFLRVYHCAMKLELDGAEIFCPSLSLFLY